MAEDTSDPTDTTQRPSGLADRGPSELGVQHTSVTSHESTETGLRPEDSDQDASRLDVPGL